MSFLKGLALTLLSVLLVATLVLFQTVNTLSGTVLSPGYFNSTLDKNATPENMKDFAGYLKENIDANGNKDLQKIVREAIDVQWLQKDAPAFLKGCVSYFATGAGKLPSVNIKPFKEALSKAIMSQGAMAAVVAESQLGLNDMKDTLDLNTFVTKLYGSENNPVAKLGGVLTGSKDMFFLLFIAVALLLLAIIAVVAYSPRSILRWGGMCLLVAGALCALAALLPVVFGNTLETQVSIAVGSANEPGLAFLEHFATAFAGGVFSYMLIQGLIVAVVGVALLVAGGFVNSTDNTGHAGLRAAAAVVLLIAIPFSSYFILQDYYTSHVRDFRTVSKMHQKMTTGAALDATVGGHLGKVIDQMSKSK